MGSTHTYCQDARNADIRINIGDGVRGPMVGRLQALYRALIEAECAGGRR